MTQSRTVYHLIITIFSCMRTCDATLFLQERVLKGEPQLSTQGHAHVHGRAHRCRSTTQLCNCGPPPFLGLWL